MRVASRLSTDPRGSRSGESRRERVGRPKRAAIVARRRRRSAWDAAVVGRAAGREADRVRVRPLGPVGGEVDAVAVARGQEVRRRRVGRHLGVVVVAQQCVVVPRLQRADTDRRGQRDRGLADRDVGLVIDRDLDPERERRAAGVGDTSDRDTLVDIARHTAALGAARRARGARAGQTSDDALDPMSESVAGDQRVRPGVAGRRGRGDSRSGQCRVSARADPIELSWFRPPSRRWDPAPSPRVDDAGGAGPVASRSTDSDWSRAKDIV